MSEKTNTVSKNNASKKYKRCDEQDYDWTAVCKNCEKMNGCNHKDNREISFLYDT